MSKKTKLTDKEKEIIKKVTDYIQYVPDEQKIYILGVVDTVGMLCRDEKAGQEAKMKKILIRLLLRGRKVGSENEKSPAKCRA